MGDTKYNADVLAEEIARQRKLIPDDGIADTSDLDCRIRNALGTTIDTGYSVTPGENVTLPAGAPDGVYTFSIRPWLVNSSAIDYLIEMEVPSGEIYPFDGKLFNATNFWSQEITSLQITKSTDGTEVTYTIVQF